jgi:hypothetical protein
MLTRIARRNLLYDRRGFVAIAAGVCFSVALAAGVSQWSAVRTPVMDVLRSHAGVGSECDRTTPRGLRVQIRHPSERSASASADGRRR